MTCLTVSAGVRRAPVLDRFRLLGLPGVIYRHNEHFLPIFFALYYFEGLTFKEIGKVLGVSESRVYQLHTQAMTRLRNFMRQEGGVQV